MGFVIDPFSSLSGIADALQGRGESSRLDMLASGARDWATQLSRFSKSIVCPMIRRVNTQYFALVFFFTLCQVIGMMCISPDLSSMEGAALLVEEGMVCPMDGTTMCPPSLTSSPERQIKNSMVTDVDHETILLSPAAVRTVPSAPTLWSWSRAWSMVPLSIGSSSVLRI